MALIIDIDKYKEELPGYDPSQAEKYHYESAKKADDAYRNAIKNYQLYNKVILLCGGSAVGKSEFISTYLNYSDNAIIFDSTLSTHEGVKTKLNEKRVRSKFDTEVIFIQPLNLVKSYLAFTGRDRKFSYKHFIKTHSGSRATFLYVLQKYATIKCRYFISDIDLIGKMSYKEINGDRNKIIESIKDSQINESDLETLLKPYLNIK